MAPSHLHLWGWAQSQKEPSGSQPSGEGPRRRCRGQGSRPPSLCASPLTSANDHSASLQTPRHHFHLVELRCPRPLGSASAPLLLLSGFLPQLVLQPDTSQSTLHSGFPTPSAMDPEVPFLSSLSCAPHCPHQPCPTPGRHRGLLTLDSTAVPLPRAPGLPPVHGQHMCPG